jgi:JNK-interacting protein leucine zipper II
MFVLDLSLTHRFVIFLLFLGMGKEVENLIMENNELLATK